MKLRNLESKDAPRMLSWMQDDSVNVFFQADFKNATLESVQGFVLKSQSDETNCHFAVVDDEDIYLGTVSLKNIDTVSKNAEFAIVLHKDAQGKGAGKFATDKILEYGFNHLGLERVYLNVFSDNLTAISLYQKLNFTYEGEFYNHICKKWWL